MYYTCQQKHIYYNLPPTSPFPFEVKQKYCFCVIVVLRKKTILFEKFTTVFKHKISFVENLHSKHTSTFKIRKNTNYYFLSTSTVYHPSKWSLIFSSSDEMAKITFYFPDSLFCSLLRRSLSLLSVYSLDPLSLSLFLSLSH